MDHVWKIAFEKIHFRVFAIIETVKLNTGTRLLQINNIFSLIHFSTLFSEIFPQGICCVWISFEPLRKVDASSSVTTLESFTNGKSSVFEKKSFEIYPSIEFLKIHFEYFFAFKWMYLNLLVALYLHHFVMK